MATNRAQAGTIASTAGTSTGGPAAHVEAPHTASSTTASGTAEITGPDAPADAAKTAENHPEVTEKAKELLDSALDAAKSDENAAEKDENVKVQVLKPHPELGAFAGEKTSLPTEMAARLIASGHVVEVSADGQALRPTYAQPTGAQLAAGAAAFERFRAVAVAEGDDLLPTEGQFSELPELIQRAFVAAIDPTYGPLA